MTSVDSSKMTENSTRAVGTRVMQRIGVLLLLLVCKIRSEAYTSINDQNDNDDTKIFCV